MLSFRARSLFTRTLLTQASAIVVLQLTFVTLLLVIPPPSRPSPSMADLVAAFAAAEQGRSPRPGTGLVLRQVRDYTEARGDMERVPALTRMLARALGKPEDEVSFARPRHFRPFPPFQAATDVVVMTQGKVILLEGFEASVRGGRGWAIISSENPPLWSSLYLRVGLVFILALGSLLPVAWWFGRGLARPIARFAEAADQIGNDIRSPLPPLQGPEELRLAANALQSMRERLRAQIDEREMMAAAIAHDLQTPLARIAFRAQKAAPALRDRIQEDVMQMRQMITAILEFTRLDLEKPQFEIFDLRDLLGRMVRQETGTGRVVDLPANKEPVAVEGDSLLLRRAIQNLLDNAAKFAGSCEVDVAADRSTVTISVSDRGPGLSEDQCKNLIAPFARGEPSRNLRYGGAGLGLAIARDIARLHRGSLHLALREGGGLTASLTINRGAYRT